MKKRNKILALLSTSIVASCATIVSYNLVSNSSNNNFNFLNSDIKYDQQIIDSKVDVFNTKLQQYSAYDLIYNEELGLNILLDQFVQFNNVDFVGEKVLLKFNISKEQFINDYKPKIIATINDSKLGTELEFYIKFNPILDLISKQIKEGSKKILLINLKPQIDFVVNQQLYDIQNSDFFRYYSASEFAVNFFSNIVGTNSQSNDRLINYQNQNNIKALINTNIMFGDFLKFKPIIKLGNVDDLNGTIKNNFIQIKIPSINKISPEWKYSEDEFETKIIYFDIINFKKLVVDINVNPNKFFDVSFNKSLANINASLFNRELFDKELIATEVTPSSNPLYLITSNLSLNILKQFISDFKISNIDNTKGTLHLSFNVKDQTNQIKNYFYIINGFKKVTYINLDNKEINKKNYDFLNNNELQNDFKNKELGKVQTYVIKNINNFFGNQKNSIFKVEETNFAEKYIDVNNIKVTMYENLGKLNINIPLKLSIENSIYFNNNLWTATDLNVILYGFNEESYFIKLKNSNINSLEALNNMNNINDFYQSFVSNVNGTISKYDAIETNLTLNEFKYQVQSFVIDKSNTYNVALVNITFYNENNDLKSIAIAINSSKQIKYNVNKETKLDASQIPFLQDKTVNNFSKEDILNLISFNNQPNALGFLSVDASRSVFENVLLSSYSINKNKNSVDVSLELKTSNDSNEKIKLQITNLKETYVNLSQILWYAFFGIIGLIIIAILGFVIHYIYRKKYAIKYNNWSNFDNNDKGDK